MNLTLDGVGERVFTSFPGFPVRSICVLPEGFLGVCLPSKACAFMEAQLNHATQVHDVELWRHLRRFICGFERLAPRFCCPHPHETYYDFSGRPDEPYIQNVFEQADGRGSGVIQGGVRFGQKRPAGSAPAEVNPAVPAIANPAPVPRPLPPYESNSSP